MSINRDNEQWLADLRDSGLVQETAIVDLRHSLLNGLRGAFAHSVGGDAAFLEDSVQDALILILERIDQFEGRSRFLTWATSIAIRSAMTKLRRKKWKDVSLDDYLSGATSETATISTAQCGPESESARAALVEHMMSTINADLTEKQRRALLAELKGVPQEEIARDLGSTRNSVYKLTHDARKRLKHGLESAGYTIGDIELAFTS